MDQTSLRGEPAHTPGVESADESNPDKDTTEARADSQNGSPLDIIGNPAGHDEEFHRLGEDIRHQRWGEALDRCRRLLNSGSATTEVYAACGNVLQHLGQHPAALDAFRSALVLGGETPALHDAAGLCCLRLRDFEGAASHFRAALDLQGQQVPLLLLHLGMALLEAGRAAEAEPVLRRAAQAAPEMAPAHFHLGLCAEARQQASEALAHYGDTVRRDPRHAAALSRAGHLLIGMGRLDEAMAVYRQVLDILPDDAQALVRIGQILTARGMLQEAVAPLRRVLARNAGHADAWAALGQVQVGLGDLEAAARSYACALRAQPDHPAGSHRACRAPGPGRRSARTGARIVAGFSNAPRVAGAAGTPGPLP